uniref:ParB/Sulfiredoxin domain-containing protein n=1 Tax=Desulfatirhabdium butyrativorans TaxID=340467 RepID=A0A7C4RUW2_9BACT
MSVFDYFIPTERSRILPLSRIQPREAVDPVRLERALEKMALAKSGILPKRRPIQVSCNPSGNYRVIDGNTTYYALVQLGEDAGVVEVVGE